MALDGCSVVAVAPRGSEGGAQGEGGAGHGRLPDDVRSAHFQFPADFDAPPERLRDAARARSRRLHDEPARRELQDGEPQGVGVQAQEGREVQQWRPRERGSGEVQLRADSRPQDEIEAIPLLQEHQERGGGRREYGPDSHEKARPHAPAVSSDLRLYRAAQVLQETRQEIPLPQSRGQRPVRAEEMAQGAGSRLRGEPQRLEKTQGEDGRREIHS